MTTVVRKWSVCQTNGGRRGRVGLTGARAVAILAVLLLAAPIGFVGVAAASVPPAPQVHVAPESVAPPGWQPPPGFVTRDDRYFVQVGDSIFGFFNAQPAGAQLFTGYLFVYLYPLTNSTHTATLKLYLVGKPNVLELNASVVVPANQTQSVQLPLPASDHYIKIRLFVDGTPVVYWTETPIQILPLGALTDGGISLVAIIALTEFLVVGLPLMAYAWRLALKAKHAPRVKAILWLHGIVLGMLAYWVINYPALNVLFSGWDWLIFPLPTMAFLFFWELGRHNRDQRALVLRGNPQSGHRLGFDWWNIYVARDDQGNLILVGQGWRDFFYAAWGSHFVKLYRRKEDGTKFEPVPASLFHRAHVNKAEDVWTPYRIPREGKLGPEDDFEITNRVTGYEDDEPAYLYFVASVDPFSIKWPTWHAFREEPTPPKLSPEGRVLIPAGTRRRFSPHVEDGSAEVRLASWHYSDVWAVAMGWQEIEDVVRAKEDLAFENRILKTHMEREIERRVEARLNADLDLSSRSVDELSPEEAAAYVEIKRGTPRAPGPPALEETGAEG